MRSFLGGLKNAVIRQPKRRIGSSGVISSRVPHHPSYGSEQCGSFLNGDITSIPTDVGLRYLAVIIDLSLHRVFGWALADASDAELEISDFIECYYHRHRKH